MTADQQALELELLADVGQPSPQYRGCESLFLKLLPERIVAVVGQEPLLAAGEEGGDCRHPGIADTQTLLGLQTPSQGLQTPQGLQRDCRHPDSAGSVFGRTTP